MLQKHTDDERLPLHAARQPSVIGLDPCLTDGSCGVILGVVWQLCAMEMAVGAARAHSCTPVRCPGRPSPLRSSRRPVAASVLVWAAPAMAASPVICRPSFLAPRGGGAAFQYVIPPPCVRPSSRPAVWPGRAPGSWHRSMGSFRLPVLLRRRPSSSYMAPGGCLADVSTSCLMAPRPVCACVDLLGAVQVYGCLLDLVVVMMLVP